MASLSYRREMDLIGPHGTSSISTRTAAKDPMSSFELAKLWWLKDPERRVRYHVDSYLSRRGRRWVSTPRAVERWKAHLASLGARSTKRSTVPVQAGR